jgi:hypothetical protein
MVVLAICISVTIVIVIVLVRSFLFLLAALVATARLPRTTTRIWHS